MTADKPGFLEELKRRHVWRVAATYVVAGWLLIQVATQVFPFFNIPNWSVRLVVVLVALGFPVAVVLAWAFELTPEGVRRTEPAGSPEARPAHETRQVGRKLNTVIITILVLAVALLGWRLLVLRHAPATAQSAAATRSPDGAQRNPGTVAPDSAAAAAASGLRTAAPTNAMPAKTIPARSIAVLPFVNEGGDKDQQYFSDGLSEDFITALSQFAGLKVISRNSAFQFRDSKDSSKAIGAKLGVAHLLEGAVQQQGGEVRITATLVNATDGSVVWSGRYDKPYKDLFALQDTITSAVAAALKTRLLANHAAAQSDRPPGGNLEAWQAYQQGKFYDARVTQADDRKAIDEYARSIRLDPRYAAAYARLSFGWTSLSVQYLSGAAQQQAYAKARQAVDTALELTPDLALAHEARGVLLLSAGFNWRGAEAEFQRAAQLAPNDAGVLSDLGTLDATLGRVQSAVALTGKALAADPLGANRYNWLSVYLAGLGRLDQAQQAVEKAIELQPAADSFHEQRAVVEILRGDAQAALAAAQQETDPGWRRVALALATQIGRDHKAADAALQTLIAKNGDNAPYQIAEVYALRRDPDDMFQWLDRAWAARDSGVRQLLYDPFILRYRNDPRFAAFCKKIGLPATTDAVAMK